MKGPPPKRVPPKGAAAKAHAAAPEAHTAKGRAAKAHAAAPEAHAAKAAKAHAATAEMAAAKAHAATAEMAAAKAHAAATKSHAAAEVSATRGRRITPQAQGSCGKPRQDHGSCSFRHGILHHASWRGAP